MQFAGVFRVFREGGLGGDLEKDLKGGGLQRVLQTGHGRGLVAKLRSGTGHVWSRYGSAQI